MNYVNGPPTYPLLGTYLEFSFSRTSQFVVRYTEESLFHERIVIELPACQKEKWVHATAKILGLTQSKQTWPVRMNYDNAHEFFTPGQLAYLERMNSNVSFVMYGAPAEKPSRYYQEAARLERQSYRKRQQVAKS